MSMHAMLSLYAYSYESHVYMYVHKYMPF
jgi:hypothetical protein